MYAQRSFAAVALGLAFVVMLVLSSAARAQAVPTTTVSGNVYQANGRPASGSLQISWPAFTTAGGQAVAAGRTSASIGSDGKVTVALAPNIGAMPAGLFYTAVYHLSDGTTSTEYWVVPNTIQATIAQVRSTVLPAAQAVQAVNKAYVDQSIAQAVSSQITPSGGTLTGPLYLAGDPIQAAQAANKHYVDTTAAQLLPIGGGTLTGPVTAPRIGAVLQADQFPGADFGAQLQACVNALDPAYGGTCDARNFPGQVAMAANLTLGVPNVTIYLPCSTIATAASILVPGGTRNVSLHGCASRGTSAASGAQGGTVLLYSGNSALLQVGDSAFFADTKGFRMDNAALNTTAATAASAQAMVFDRTQEISLASLYVLGNSNQTGLTLDGTGNYSGGTFEDMQFTGFQAAVNGIGHTVDNAATTDWLNASSFLRVHIDCPTQNGSPVAGTTGINLQAGDGNTFTGGDVEGCATALHLGAHAVNNTLVGVRNENSTTQILADAGSSYNSWITGGTMYTGKLVDNGTRNSFLDTFHRSFNGVNGDWYGSQQDATVTNHYRLGIGTGSERGLLDRYQTDFGYRWTTGLSDASGGIQYYQVLDELNHVYRLSLGQYNNGQGATNNQTVLNAAGTGAVILNGTNNAGTGGVVFGSGGPSSSTVATVDQAGNANFLGTMLVGGAAQSTGTMTVRNNADAEVDYYLWPGVTSSQKGSFTYKDFNGSSQWYMLKDQANNWALNSAPGGLDSFKAYQSTNSGDTYINAAKSTGHIRLNYETGAGAETDIYSGSSSSLAAAFLGPTAIKLPGLATASGKNCIQIDSSGYLSNTGGGCGLAAVVATAGLAFSDGSVQTTSQQGALTGQANDATARSAAATAENDAQSGITNAAAAQTSASSALNGQANDGTARTAAALAESHAQSGIANAAAAQTSANSALNGQANDGTARTAAASAENDAQTGITNAAVAQGSANSALSGQANDSAARISAATAETDAQTGISAASAAQSTADAALAISGATSTGSGSSSNVTFPGAVAAGSMFSLFKPVTNADAYISVDTVHGGNDYGAILTAAANAQGASSICYIRASQGLHLMYTPAVIYRSCILDLQGAQLVPAIGSDSPAAWNSAPVTIANATLTAGSQAVTYPSTGGIVGSMAIGGVGVPNASYVVTSPAPTTTSLTTALPNQLMFTGIVTNGSATITGVSSMRGLVGGNVQAVQFPAVPSGASAPWTWAGGGVSATIASFDPNARTVTFSAAINVASNLNRSAPVTFTLVAGSTWTATLTAQQTAPMIQIVPGPQTQPKWQGMRIEGGIYGGWLVDPAFSSSSAGRSISGVQGVQIAAYDGFKLRGLRVNGLSGSALIIGGNDYGGALCSSSNAWLGSPRESNFSDLQIWESGDWKTGQPQLEIAGPRCWNGTQSVLMDQPNELTFTGSKFSSSWGPSVTITSFNTNIWQGIGNPANNNFFTDDQFEGGGRTGAPGPPPSRSIDIQNAATVNFTSDEFAVSAYGYCLFCVDTAKSLIIQSSNWGLAGNGDYAPPIYVTLTNGGTTATYVSGGNPGNGFPTTGEWDDQAVRIVDASTPYLTYTTLSGSVSGDGRTLTLSGPFAGPTCNSSSPCAVYTGFAGYPVDITQSLGNLSIGGTSITTTGTVSNAFLYPGSTLPPQPLVISGSCGARETIDYLNFANSTFCVYLQNTGLWGNGMSQPASSVSAASLPPGGDVFQSIGQSSTASNFVARGFHYNSAGSPTNFGFESVGAGETSYNVQYTTNGTTFTKAVNFNIATYPNQGQTSGTGTTAGTYKWVMPQQGTSGKLVWLTLTGYENMTPTAQTITLPSAFGSATSGIVTLSGSCSGITYSGATVTLPASMGSVQTGFCKIEGY